MTESTAIEYLECTGYYTSKQESSTSYLILRDGNGHLNFARHTRAETNLLGSYIPVYTHSAALINERLFLSRSSSRAGLSTAEVQLHIRHGNGIVVRKRHKGLPQFITPITAVVLVLLDGDSPNSQGRYHAICALQCGKHIIAEAGASWHQIAHPQMENREVEILVQPFPKGLRQASAMSGKSNTAVAYKVHRCLHARWISHNPDRLESRQESYEFYVELVKSIPHETSPNTMYLDCYLAARHRGRKGRTAQLLSDRPSTIYDIVRLSVGGKSPSIDMQGRRMKVTLSDARYRWVSHPKRSDILVRARFWQQSRSSSPATSADGSSSHRSNINLPSPIHSSGSFFTPDSTEIFLNTLQHPASRQPSPSRTPTPATASPRKGGTSSQGGQSRRAPGILKTNRSSPTISIYRNVSTGRSTGSGAPPQTNVFQHSAPQQTSMQPDVPHPAAYPSGFQYQRLPLDHVCGGYAYNMYTGQSDWVPGNEYGQCVTCSQRAQYYAGFPQTQQSGFPNPTQIPARGHPLSARRVVPNSTQSAKYAPYAARDNANRVLPSARRASKYPGTVPSGNLSALPVNYGQNVTFKSPLLRPPREMQATAQSVSSRESERVQSQPTSAAITDWSVHSRPYSNPPVRPSVTSEFKSAAPSGARIVVEDSAQEGDIPAASARGSPGKPQRPRVIIPPASRS